MADRKKGKKRYNNNIKKIVRGTLRRTQILKALSFKETQFYKQSFYNLNTIHWHSYTVMLYIIWKTNFLLYPLSQILTLQSALQVMKRRWWYLLMATLYTAM